MWNVGRAMFSPDVVGTDGFLDLPMESQLLYFRLGFEGAYGKVQGVKRIARGYGCGADALEPLYDAGYLFDHGGACWIRHYWVNNTFKRPNHNYAMSMPEIVSGEIGFEGEPFKSAFICPEADKPSVSLMQGSTGTVTGTDSGLDSDSGPDSDPGACPSPYAGGGARGEGEPCPNCGEPLREFGEGYVCCEACRGVFSVDGLRSRAVAR